MTDVLVVGAGLAGLAAGRDGARGARPARGAGRADDACGREQAFAPAAVLRRDWGLDPFTQGYATQWAPGDVMAVGQLHGTHEPPFYVAGSDHRVAGYMEGAVRTGRQAARAILAA
jgi:monoamine oxidase